MKYVVTIITVCYNAEIFIEETIKSVISQNDITFEYIIIDGLSNDKTLSIISNYQNHINLVISEKDKGIYDAMNKGIHFANGDWIIFMNAGDTFYNNNTLFNIFNRIIDPNVTLLYGATSFFSNQKFKISYPKKLERIWCGMPICHQSMLVKTDYLKRNTFDLKYKYASDYNLLYNICINNKNSIKNLNLIISTITINGFSESNSIGTYKEYMEISLTKNRFTKLISLYFYFRITERFFIKTLKNIIHKR
jgi:glycosyltransferase involved in cell wall biosynthesis